MNPTVAVRPIRNDADLDAALARFDEIFHADPGTPEDDERKVLAVLIHAYEQEHYPLSQDDPIEVLRAHMDRLDLRPKDLIPYLGSQPRVSEVLAGKRRLTVEMITALSRGLRIPAEDLLPAEPRP